MVSLRLPTFAGMIPSIDPHILSASNAAESVNTWLYSGALDGIPEEIPIHTMVNPAAVLAYRIPLNMDDPTDLLNSFWMEFDSPNVSFIRTPVSGDTHRRHYWAQPGLPPRYNTMQRMLNGDPAFLLGLPEPEAVGVSVTGGSSTTLVSRAYIATYVTAYGEEGPASAPTLVNGKLDSTFNLTIPAVNAADMGTNRNIAKINVYRTIVSAAGTATYYLVTSVNASTSTQAYADSAPDLQIASAPILESIMWTQPPQLEGMVVMPNGIVAGWIGNELWFSEPYRPHAWPAPYSLSIEDEIVGMAVIGQTLVVCTTGAPMTASGVNPANITTSKMASIEPCMSRGSIVPTEMGVFYTSPNGLILVQPGLAQNVTKDVITIDHWRELANKAKVRAARLGSAYFAYGSGMSQAFQQDMFQTNMVQQADNVGSAEGFLIDAGNQNAAVSYLEAGAAASSVHNDHLSGEILIVREGVVYHINHTVGFNIQPYRWLSKKLQTPKLENFTAFKCYMTVPSTFNPSGPPNHDLIQDFDPATQLALARVYADGRLVATRELRKSGELHRLPTGYKAEVWQVEFEGVTRITSFQMATSIKELSVV